MIDTENNLILQLSTITCSYEIPKHCKSLPNPINLSINQYMPIKDYKYFLTVYNGDLCHFPKSIIQLKQAM